MKICFKMNNSNNPQLVNSVFILSEPRFGKKYGKMLSCIYISEQNLRNGEFSAILGFYCNNMNHGRWMKNRHNNKNGMRHFNICPNVESLFDSNDYKQVTDLENEFFKNHPIPSNILSDAGFIRWTDFVREKKDLPKAELIKKLYEQDVE